MDKDERIDRLIKINQNLRDELEKCGEAYETLARAAAAQLLTMSTKVEHAVGKCMLDIAAIAKDTHPFKDD